MLPSEPAARRAHADANGEQQHVQSKTPDKFDAQPGMCAHNDYKDPDNLRELRFPWLIYAVMLRDLAATPPFVPASLAALYAHCSRRTAMLGDIAREGGFARFARSISCTDQGWRLQQDHTPANEKLSHKQIALVL